MDHGIDAFFEAQAANRRRLSGLAFTIGVVLLVPLLLIQFTPIGKPLRRMLVLRFGFEGPPRYVQLVQVDASPTIYSTPTDVGRVVVDQGRPGVAGTPRTIVRGPRGTRVKFTNPGITDAGRDLMARALASRGHTPIFQSSDLVIETLVRPEYPEHARDRGIEGHVAVLAHVDTLGRVVEAEVTNPSGEQELDAASQRAVLQCKFRPYREGDRVREVYAVFRFSFRIY